MRTLLYWAPIIRGRWFNSLFAGLLVLLLGLAFPWRDAGAASTKPGKKKHATKNATKKKKASKSTPSTSARKQAVAPSPPPAPRLTEGPATPLQAAVRKLRSTPTPANRAALADYAAGQKGVNGALALLALGIADVERKQFPAAQPSLKAAQVRVPQLADYAAYWTASASLEAGDFDAAIKALDPVWALSPDSPLLPNAALLAARAHLQRGNPAAAISLLKSFAERLPQPKGDMLLASSLEAARDPQAAAASWQRVYYDYPNSAEAADAATALARLRNDLGSAFPTPSSKVQLSRIGRLIEGKQFSSARRELEGLLPGLPEGDRDVARVRLGAIAFQAGESSEAIRYLKPLEVKDPEANAERLYYIASAYRRTDNDEEFNRTLDRLNHYSHSRWRLQALVMAGNRYLLQNDTEKYERYYKAGYENFADQPEGAYCHWKVTWLHYIQRRGDADDYLRRHLKTFPFSEKAGASLYFLGRLAEGKNKSNAARTWYNELTTRFPNSYYAMLARERLAALPRPAGGPAVAYSDESGTSQKVPSGIDRGVAKFLEEIEWPARNQTPVFDTTPVTKHRLERARLLQAAGLDDMAESELRYGAKNEGPAPLLAMELAASATRRGSPDQGIRFIKGLVPDYLYVPMESAPAAFWRLAFPIPYRTDLEHNARQYDMDPYQVAALIRQESEFNPRALSYAKAYGLTQVLPSTGRSLSKRVGIKHFSTAMLWRPDINLKLGTYFLHSLLTSFNGRWEPTLASYNAGKSRVDAWLTWAEYKEPAEFIENIPITQTRDYVQVVIRNADVYRKLYGASAAAVSSTNGTAAGNRSNP